jgi:hypothetical protein
MKELISEIEVHTQDAEFELEELLGFPGQPPAPHNRHTKIPPLLVIIDNLLHNNLIIVIIVSF